MHRVETLTDVPDSMVKEVVADFKSEGASVTKTKQANGSWIVVATFPDVPTGGDGAENNND